MSPILILLCAMKRLILCFAFLLQLSGLTAQKNFIVYQDLREQWMRFDGKQYSLIGDNMGSQNIIYLKIDSNQFPDSHMLVESDKPYFLFINGRLAGEYAGRVLLKLDSLTEVNFNASFYLGIYQPDINERELKTAIVSQQEKKTDTIQNLAKPPVFFRDFIIASG